MEAIEAILTRRTVPQVKMGDPGPDLTELDQILAAGAAAPDHGKLRPWRFLVVQGERRRQLGELFAEAVRQSNPDATHEETEKQLQAPMRAPLIIVVVARTGGEGKIPVVERIASAAAAAQNMLLATHALGFAGKWSTGKNAYDPWVRRGLDLKDEDQIVGFLYIGSYMVPQEPSPRPTLDEITTAWPD